MAAFTSMLQTAVLLLLAQLVSLCAADICRKKGVFRDEYLSCSAGCCGSDYDRFCCAESTGGSIVGIVIGVLLCILIIVSVVVCCVCCCRRSPGQRGHIIHSSSTQHHVTVVSGSTNTGFLPTSGYVPPNTYPGGYPAPSETGPTWPVQPPSYTGAASQDASPPPYSEVVKGQQGQQ